MAKRLRRDLVSEVAHAYTAIRNPKPAAGILRTMTDGIPTYVVPPGVGGLEMPNDRETRVACASKFGQTDAHTSLRLIGDNADFQLKTKFENGATDRAIRYATQKASYGFAAGKVDATSPPHRRLSRKRV